MEDEDNPVTRRYSSAKWKGSSLPSLPVFRALLYCALAELLGKSDVKGVWEAECEERNSNSVQGTTES